MLSGTIKAGKVMDVVSLTLYSDNLGVCGIPVNAVEFIGLEEHKPGDRRDPIPPGPEWEGPNNLPPWIGPNKSVAVPEFVPKEATKQEPVKPPSGGEHKRAAKPVAAGHLSMFDQEKKGAPAASVAPVVPVKAAAKKPSLEEIDFDE